VLKTFILENYRAKPGMPRAFLIKSRAAGPVLKKENTTQQSDLLHENAQPIQTSTNLQQGKIIVNF